MNEKREINEKISGWYPELRTRVEKLTACGITVSSMSQRMEVSNTILAKWLSGQRGLNHAHAPKIEEMIKQIKEEVAQI